MCEANWSKDFISKEVNKCHSIFDFFGIKRDSDDLVDLDSCKN